MNTPKTLGASVAQTGSSGMPQSVKYQNVTVRVGDTVTLPAGSPAKVVNT